MPQTLLTGQSRLENLPAVLRAFYGAGQAADSVSAMETMPELVFMPESALGVVTNGGDEGVDIQSGSPPIVTIVHTDIMGKLLGFRQDQLASQVSFGFGHARVQITPGDDHVIFTVTYPDPGIVPEEQVRVGRALSALLTDIQIQ